ncbi:unnamed protein product [Caenorhabditis sp. 36 PRJEB53466]|nr:unnamed protein product [Caenorhabditis sp. 36 PRJEB53466]
MRTEALFFVILGFLTQNGLTQYQQPMQFQGNQGYQQQGGGFQEQGGGYQSGGGGQSRYQQSHVIVGPGPVIGGGGGNFGGGQFKEQRTIQIKEDITGVQQAGGYGGYGGASGYQYNQQYGQRFGQQGYGGQAGGQQIGTSGRSVFSNNPVVLDSTGNTLMGAEVDLKLTSYTNSGLRLPNGTTCNCPISNCNYVPSNQQNQCQFSFVLVISSADQSIQYTQSNFYPVPSNGIMTTGNWTNQYTFYMTTKPVAIDVFVQHLGVVIDSTSGQLLFFNHLALVDSFVVDISKFNTDSAAQGQAAQTLTLTGLNQQTTLQMNLNVQCINNFVGPLCDLTCNTTNVLANQGIICYSNRTATFSACKMNTLRTQVVDCVVCTHGVYNGTCAAAVVVNNWGVAYAFRTWTIVLGCLLGIALLLILCLILAYLICFRVLNRANEKDGEYYKSYENTNYESKNTSSKNHTRSNGKAGSDHGSDQPLVTNEEWTSTTATRKPVGILRPEGGGRTSQEHVQTHTSQEQNRQVLPVPPQQISGRVVRGSTDYGERRQDSPSTEDSFVANGQIQHTTTTETRTTRREHIV